MSKHLSPAYQLYSAREDASNDLEGVLDQLSPCPNPEAIEIGRHGLVLQYMGRSGVFLPQVPVEQGWDLDQYLTNLCYKAGLPDGSWKKQGARLFWYEGFKFQARG